jgi:hypothetical protein
MALHMLLLFQLIDKSDTNPSIQLSQTFSMPLVEMEGRTLSVNSFDILCQE